MENAQYHYYLLYGIECFTGAKTPVESILPPFSGTWDAVIVLCIIYDWS